MAEGAGSEDAGPSSSLTHKEGYLLKNHKGKSFEALSLKRWFVSEGFQVQYFDQPGSNRVRKGRFDLRNVSDLRPAVDNGVKRGVELNYVRARIGRRNLIVEHPAFPELLIPSLPGCFTSSGIYAACARQASIPIELFTMHGAARDYAQFSLSSLRVACCIYSCCIAFLYIRHM